MHLLYMLEDLLALLNPDRLFAFSQSLSRREEVDSDYNDEGRREEMFSRFSMTKLFTR